MAGWRRQMLELLLADGDDERQESTSLTGKNAGLFSHHFHFRDYREGFRDVRRAMLSPPIFLSSTSRCHSTDMQQGELRSVARGQTDGGLVQLGSCVNVGGSAVGLMREDCSVGEGSQPATQ